MLLYWAKKLNLDAIMGRVKFSGELGRSGKYSNRLVKLKIIKNLIKKSKYEP